MVSPLGDYLRARRGLLRPEDVGMRSMSGRRVEGLRRDEVAQLAGISPEYYLRIEQGRGHQPSDQVLRSLARALNLDSDALRYMTRLVDVQSGVSRRGELPHIGEALEVSVGAMIDRWSSTPALLTDRNQTIILANDLARAVLPGAVDRGSNLVLKVFSNEWRVSDLDWETTANRSLAALRFHGNLTDPRFQDILGLLSMRDGDFRRIWAKHEASPFGSGELHLDTATHGKVDLFQESLTPAGDEIHFLHVLHAEAGSPAAVMIESLRASTLMRSSDDSDKAKSDANEASA